MLLSWNFWTCIGLYFWIFSQNRNEVPSLFNTYQKRLIFETKNIVVSSLIFKMKRLKTSVFVTFISWSHTLNAKFPWMSSSSNDLRVDHIESPSAEAVDWCDFRYLSSSLLFIGFSSFYFFFFACSKDLEFYYFTLQFACIWWHSSPTSKLTVWETSPNVLKPTQSFDSSLKCFYPTPFNVHLSERFSLQCKQISSDIYIYFFHLEVLQ